MVEVDPRLAPAQSVSVEGCNEVSEPTIHRTLEDPWDAPMCSAELTDRR